MKKIISISLILMLFMTSCGLGGNDDVIVEGNIEDIALAYVEDLLEGNYEEAYKEYVHDSAMKRAVSTKFYEQMMIEISAACGEVIEVKEPFTYESQGYMIVSIPIEYTVYSININVVFDENKYIAGVHQKEYTEAEEDGRELPSNITEETLVANVNGLEFDGLLTKPKEGTDFPAVVIVHGSGAVDKDLSLGPNKIYRDIAWGLSERGIAVYRYDKRTFAYSENFMDDYNFTVYDETVDDAVEIAKMIQTLDDIDEDNVYVLGHSLGGHLIPRIAEESDDLAGYVIMAGNVRGLDELIVEQVQFLIEADGEVTKEEQEVLDDMKEVARKIRELDMSEEEMVFGAYKSYWEDLNSYNPLEIAESIYQPVLVLQGERDYQVTMQEYDLWYEAFGENDNWEFKSYPELNHLMTSGEGEPSQEEYYVQQYVDERVIENIATWIMENK